MTFAEPALAAELEEGKSGTRAWTRREVLPWQVLNALCFGLNVIAVSIEGRLDSAAGRTDPNQADLLNYVGPAGYAFIIWAAIYLSESVFVLWQLLQQQPGRLALIRAASPGWCAGNLFQVLWCITYRDPLDTFGTLWISSLMLSATAFGLSFAHGVAVKAEGIEQVVMLAPITLHFGWTTAAALVNWNGMFAHLYNPPIQVVMSVISLIIAAAVGVGVSWSRRAPGYVCTVAWAAFWVGFQTFQLEDFAEQIGATGALLLATFQLVTGLGLLAFGIGLKVVLVRSEK